MTTPDEPTPPMDSQALGAETPCEGGMLQVYMDAQGRAQAILRDGEYNVVAATPIVGPPEAPEGAGE